MGLWPFGRRTVAPVVQPACSTNIGESIFVRLRGRASRNEYEKLLINGEKIVNGEVKTTSIIIEIPKWYCHTANE